MGGSWRGCKQTQWCQPCCRCCSPCLHWPNITHVRLPLLAFLVAVQCTKYQMCICLTGTLLVRPLTVLYMQHLCTKRACSFALCFWLCLSCAILMHQMWVHVCSPNAHQNKYVCLPYWLLLPSPWCCVTLEPRSLVVDSVLTASLGGDWLHCMCVCRL